MVINKVTVQASLWFLRSVSFNGVSVMVDTIMSVYNSVSKVKEETLQRAVKDDDVDVIRQETGFQENTGLVTVQLSGIWLLSIHLHCLLHFSVVFPMIKQNCLRHC